MNTAIATIDNQTATNSRKTPSTKQELIAANIKLLIEQLEAGHSDALTNYLTAMSRFHNYSFGNVLEIARQMPTATRVAGFWTWKNLGRSVNAGAKGIRILAPIVGVKHKKAEEAEKDITQQNTRTLLEFRNAYVFDISQTNGVELPEMHQVSGDTGEKSFIGEETFRRRPFEADDLDRPRFGGTARNIDGASRRLRQSRSHVLGRRRRPGVLETGGCSTINPVDRSRFESRQPASLYL